MAYGIRDSKRCDCPRAKQSKCVHPYWFGYGRNDATGLRFSVDVQAGYHVATRGEAETLGEQWIDQIRLGTFVRRERGAPAVSAPATGQGLTLAEFSTVYIRDYAMLKNADQVLPEGEPHRDYHVFQPLLRFTLADGRVLGQMAFAAVTEQMYELFVGSRRKQGLAASTVNKDVQLIKEMTRWGVRRGYLPVNPITDESKILVRKENAQRHRAISDDELKAMHAYCDAHGEAILWAFIQVALATCLRLTELYRLRWSAFRTGAFLQVHADATKTGVKGQRNSPVDDAASATLAFLRLDPAGRQYPDTDYIFGQCGEAPAEINKRFNTMVLNAFPAIDATTGEAVPIQWVNGAHGPAAQARRKEIDLKFGDLRHEGALRKYRAGWKLNELQMLLGHTNLVQTSTYLGVGNEEVLRAMATYGSGIPVFDGGTPRGHTGAHQSPEDGQEGGGGSKLTH